MERVFLVKKVYIILFMLIVTHILVSLFSFGLATSTLVRPNAIKLGMSYTLIILSIISGAALAIGQDINIIHICSVGIAYTVVVTYMTVMGGRKLASLEIED